MPGADKRGPKRVINRPSRPESDREFQTHLRVFDSIQYVSIYLRASPTVPVSASESESVSVLVSEADASAQCLSLCQRPMLVLGLCTESMCSMLRLVLGV